MSRDQHQPRARQRAALIGVGALSAVVTAGAIGFSAVGSSRGAGAPVAALDGPAVALSEFPGDTAGGLVAGDGRILPDTLHKVGSYPDGVTQWVAETGDGKLCFLAVDADGGTGSSCNHPSILDTWGALPLVMHRPGGVLVFNALVKDGYTTTRVEGKEGAKTTKITNNGIHVVVPPDARNVLISGPAGERTLGLGMFVGPDDPWAR